MKKYTASMVAMSFGFIAIFALTGCEAFAPADGSRGPTPTSKPRSEMTEREAVADVLTADEQLGKIRNHAPETGPIDIAAREYADALADLDYTNTPLAFQRAFAQHWTAWHDMAAYLEPHSELRGEMHDVFDQLEDPTVNPTAAEFKRRLDKIWSTWAEVEAATPKEM